MRIRKSLIGLAAAIAAGVMSATAMGATTYAVNSGGEFIVSDSSLIKTFAQSVLAGTDTYGILATDVGGYADAGIVLGFDGSLKLSDLLGVTFTASPNPVSVNLWIDTSGNGSFFAFDGPGPGERKLTGLDGDSYVGADVGSGSIVVDGNTVFSKLAGTVPAGTHTLNDLKSLFPNASVAVWIGLVGQGTGGSIITNPQIQAVPLPAAVWGGMTLLGGMGAFRVIRRRHA